MNKSTYVLRADDVAVIDELLEHDIEDMLEQQRVTHDYTPGELRSVRLRNARIRRALHLKED